jgi:hypothetical protein
MTSLFEKNPEQDAKRVRRSCRRKKRGVHFFFRRMLFPMRERFAQLIDHTEMPRVFLHGNPHIDNYSKTPRGAALADFDRSREGPYAWDLVRLMVSISLRKGTPEGFLSTEVLRSLRLGYLRGLRNPDRPFVEMRKLREYEPDPCELSTNAYIAADKKWAREMRARPMRPSTPRLAGMIRAYARSREESGLLKHYFIEKAGQSRSSMGLRRVFIVVLAPRRQGSRRDRILLVIKQVYSDPDNAWYRNPFSSDVERMRHAARLYAPGWDMRPGHFRHAGKEYFARQVPPFNKKLKKPLDRKSQKDFAFAVGSQLGRAHRLSVGKASAPRLRAHFSGHFPGIVRAGRLMRNEIEDAHQRYLEKIKKLDL